MLKMTVGKQEYFDEENSRILYKGGTVLELEHSLVSLSKWEEIHEKPFLGKDDKTPEEILSYIQCMIVSPEVDQDLLQKLTKEEFDAITDYINRKMTATWFSNLDNSQANSETITAELIYYWMTTSNIPMEAKHWHLNKLFTLLKIVAAKSQKPKKMNREESLAQRRALNAERLKAMEGGH